MLCPASLCKNSVHGYEWEVLIKMFSGEKMIKERKIKIRQQRGGKRGQKITDKAERQYTLHLEDSGANINCLSFCLESFMIWLRRAKSMIRLRINLILRGETGLTS